MKIRYYISLTIVFLSYSSAFSLNDEVDEQINSPLSTTKVLTKTWDHDGEKPQQSGLQIHSKSCSVPKDTSSNIVVENAIFMEKTSKGWRKYWIDEGE